MTTATIEISANSRDVLLKLATEEGLSLSALRDKAIAHYRRQSFLRQVNQADATLKQDPKAWEGIKEEREAWDAALDDGLQLQDA